MNIDSQNGLTPAMYTRIATVSSESRIAGSVSKNSELRQDTSSPAYTVSLSSDGVNQSRAVFEAGQRSALLSFERELSRDEQAKTRELDAEKRVFDRDQAAEEREFENNQRLEKIRFLSEQG